MPFNSYAFLGFFFLFYVIYLSLSTSHKAQNTLLLVASYVFYALFDWRLVPILIMITLINYFLAIGIEGSRLLGSRRGKIYLILSVVANGALLGFFKYFNFFADSVVHVLNRFGLHPSEVTLKILIPLGISYYTFMGLGYAIDVSRGKIPATKNLLHFSLFMSFFPQIACGPIGRASDLLPQFASPRKIDAAQVDTGILLILWGFFQKLVIADNLGLLVDRIFNGYSQFQGLDIVLGIIAFTVQIFCDFSGYTDIARGIAKLMGIDLMVNFNLPYFAVNPRDFWSRWHISLSSWLRDYLYISLGGNRKGPVKTYRNLGMTMLLCGLWHGAAWNYVIWGGYHGLVLIIHRLIEKSRFVNDTRADKRPTVSNPVKMATTFAIVSFGWLIFRSRTMDQFMYLIKHVGLGTSANSADLAYSLFFFSLPLVLVSFYQFLSGNLIALQKTKPWFRIPLYGFFILWIVVFGVREPMEFIYFNF